MCAKPRRNKPTLAFFFKHDRFTNHFGGYAVNKLKLLNFKDFISLQRGFDLPKEKMNPGIYPVVGSTSIIGYHDEFKVDPPGVVMGRSGSLGIPQYVSVEFWPHNTSLWVKDFKGNFARYVYYLLQTLDLERFNAGTGVPTLNRNHLDSLKLMVHDFQTQRKIADILSSYDELIEINQQRIALLERAGREMYREWFVRLRFPGHERTKIVDGVPEGWESKTYSDVFKFLGGFAFKSKTYQPEGRFGIVTIKNVHNARFIPECASRLDAVPEKMKEHCVLAIGDILLSLTGDVGRCCMVFGESYLLNQRVAKVVGSTDIPKSFAYWTFSNEPTRRKLENLAHGAAQSNLSPVTLGNREFIKPESIVLDLFGKIADPIFWQITTLNLVIVQLNRARDLLLPRLMSGKLTV